jgi:hypothetical protein
MSDRKRRLAGLLFLASLTLRSASGMAQDPGALQRRVARLDTLRREAAAVSARADRTRWERLDTVRASGLVIVVRPADAELAQRAAEIAWASLDSLYGDAATELAAQPMLFSTVRHPLRYLPSHAEHLRQVMALDAATAGDAASQIILAGAMTMTAQADSAVAGWLGTTLLPSAHVAAEYSRIYVELVTAPSIAVRQCYAGNLSGCRSALGVVDGGDPLLLWYDAPERRALVQRTQDTHGWRTHDATDACVVASSDAACLEVLRALSWMDPPLSGEARHSLARLVLSVGGRAAYVRLLRSAGRPLSERLAIAAGLPSDSLMRRWRTTILAARPRAVTLSAPGAWMALSWAVGFGLLALRSTRWR